MNAFHKGMAQILAVASSQHVYVSTRMGVAELSECACVRSVCDGNYLLYCSLRLVWVGGGFFCIMCLRECCMLCKWF